MSRGPEKSGFISRAWEIEEHQGAKKTMPHNSRCPSNQVALSCSFMAVWSHQKKPVSFFPLRKRIRSQVDFKRCGKVRMVWKLEKNGIDIYEWHKMDLQNSLDNYRYQETNQAVSRCNFCMLVRSPSWKNAADRCSHCPSHCAKFRLVISLVFRGFSQPEDDMFVLMMAVMFME